MRWCLYYFSPKTLIKSSLVSLEVRHKRCRVKGYVQIFHHHGRIQLRILGKSKSEFERENKWRDGKGNKKENILGGWKGGIIAQPQFIWCLLVAHLGSYEKWTSSHKKQFRSFKWVQEGVEVLGRGYFPVEIGYSSVEKMIRRETFRDESGLLCAKSELLCAKGGVRMKFTPFQTDGFRCALHHSPLTMLPSALQ